MHIPSLLLSILGVVSIASAFPSRISKPERLSQKLDANADEDSLRYQPAFYFDKETCNRTTANGLHGPVKTGVSNGASCFQRSLLSNREVYTRKRCNNGWCAYMYEYDIASVFLYGRRRWENIVVFVKNNTVRHVAASDNGVYIRRDKPHLQEGHPLMLSHGPDSTLVTALRFANKGHVKKIRKDVGEWVVPNLYDWDGSPTPAPKEKFLSKYLWREKFHLADEHFTDTLYEAAGECVPGFDCGEVETKDTHKEKQKKKVKGKDKHEAEEIERGPEEVVFKKFDINEDKEDDEKEEKKENKFDIKENGKDKEDKNDKNDKKNDEKDNKKDEKKENKFEIKENGKDKEDKKENEKEDDKDDKDGKDDKKEDKNQFDIKKQKDEDK